MEGVGDRGSGQRFPFHFRLSERKKLYLYVSMSGLVHAGKRLVLVLIFSTALSICESFETQICILKELNEKY